MKRFTKLLQVFPTPAKAPLTPLIGNGPISLYGFVAHRMR